MKIAVYGKDEAFIDTLRAKGCEVFRFRKDFSSWEDLPSDVELFLALGGDGTFLKSLALVRDRNIPLAGINFGRLGFLTTAKVENGNDGVLIDRLLAGEYNVEHRDLLKVECSALPADFYPYAGNEITIQRHGASMLATDVKIDGRPVPTYWSDGIVIATPTGSTAYSLSVGGPIVDPRSNVVVLAPIAPHNLNMRPLILPMGVSFELVVSAREGSAILTVDNRSSVIPSGITVKVERGDYGFNYASFSDTNFITALRTKLLWGEDRRNV